MTTTVLCSMTGPAGEALAGVRVTAKLTGLIVADPLVVPKAESATTGLNGTCSLQLVPNGTSGTTYSFEILLPGFKVPAYYHGIVVPDQTSVTLSVLLGFGAGPGGELTFWDDALTWDDTLIWAEGSAEPLTYWNDTLTWQDAAIWTE